MKTLATALTCIGFLAISYAPAVAAPARQPIGKWVVDYGETLCTASRVYGSNEKPISLAFRPSPNGTVVRLIMVRPGRVPNPHHFPVKTTITSETAATTGVRFETSDKKFEVVWINFQRAALEGLATAGEIAIKAPGIVSDRFALPGMPAVLKALDACNDNLRKHWNVDEVIAPLSKTAVAVKPLHQVFSSNDYPHQAIREGATGTTRMLLMVDETGALKDCMVEEASSIASLDTMACGVLLERAKFTPALDAAGKPTRSVLRTAVTWRMPR